MRVVFVLEIPTPYRDPLLEYMATAHGIDLHVLYCAERDPWREWANRSVSFPHETLRGRSVGGQAGGTAWKMNPWVTSRLSALKPDVVVVGGYAHPTMQLAMAWARRRSVPYAVMCESHDLTPRGPWLKMAKTPLVRRAVKGASAFLPTGTLAREYLLRWGARRDRAFLFPNVPDVHGIAAACQAARRQAGGLRAPNALGADPLFLYVGRFVPAKNLGRLLLAFERVQAKIPSAGLLLVGSGPLQHELQAQVFDRGLTGVHFKGFVQPDALPAQYAMADVFVLPSQFEPWGVVVQEAMACGLPVVVSDRVGCAPDLVEDGGNGFVVSPHDVAGTAGALMYLSKEGEARQRMGQAASAAALCLDYEAVTGNFLDCLHSTERRPGERSGVNHPVKRSASP